MSFLGTTPKRPSRLDWHDEDNDSTELLVDDAEPEHHDGGLLPSSKRPSRIVFTWSTYAWFAAAAALLLSGVVFAWHRWLSSPAPGFDRNLLLCGEKVFYMVNNHTCTTGDFLCPVIDRRRTLRCGNSCYLPSAFTCLNGELSPIANGSAKQVLDNATAACNINYMHLKDGPSENYFLSDCSSSNQVLVTSPLPAGQQDLGNSRLLIAWEAGNSGIVLYFKAPKALRDSASMSLLVPANDSLAIKPLISGLSGTIEFDEPAELGSVVIGSIRSLRDFIEGGRALNDDVQRALRFKSLPGGGVLITRQWLDRTTEAYVTLRPSEGNKERIMVHWRDVFIPRGKYDLQAWHNHPFIENLDLGKVLKSSIEPTGDAVPSKAASLLLLSYNDKVVAGAWRFLTYFGRDSLLSLLLLQPLLSEGKGSIVEVILSAAIERINAADGSVCHEEVVGDYATLIHQREGTESSEPLCDYKMIDTDYLLAIAIEAYFVKSAVGRERAKDFLATTATFLPANRGLTYNDLLQVTLNKIMEATAAFERDPTIKNLIRLRNKEDVGQWRDSNDGLVGGRIPYDVNTALVPAALGAIGSLHKQNMLFGSPDNFGLAAKRALFWQENTLHFFEVIISPDEANAMLDNYIMRSDYKGPKSATRQSKDVVFHGLALRASSGDSVVRVMNTDDCFRLFLVNTTNDEQLSSFLRQTASNILAPFPVGLSTPLGIVVANPAYAADDKSARVLTTGAYHGTVIWSWQLAMMAAGLERQLDRCGREQLQFCVDANLRRQVEEAYNHLWDLIDANQEHTQKEAWTWTYGPGEEYHYAAMGTIPGPGGESAVESNVQQLWSLASLAVQRNPNIPRIATL